LGSLQTAFTSIIVYAFIQDDQREFR